MTDSFLEMSGRETSTDLLAIMAGTLRTWKTKGKSSVHQKKQTLQMLRLAIRPYLKALMFPNLVPNIFLLSGW